MEDRRSQMMARFMAVIEQGLPAMAAEHGYQLDGEAAPGADEAEDAMDTDAPAWPAAGRKLLVSLTLQYKSKKRKRDSSADARKEKKVEEGALRRRRLVL